MEYSRKASWVTIGWHFVWVGAYSQYLSAENWRRELHAVQHFPWRARPDVPSSPGKILHVHSLEALEITDINIVYILQVEVYI